MGLDRRLKTVHDYLNKHDGQVCGLDGKHLGRAEVIEEKDQEIIFEVERHGTVGAEQWTHGHAMKSMRTWWDLYAFDTEEKDLEKLQPRRDSETVIDVEDYVTNELNEGMVSFDFTRLDNDRWLCKDTASGEEAEITKPADLREFVVEVFEGMGLDSMMDSLRNLQNMTVETFMERYRSEWIRQAFEKAQESWKNTKEQADDAGSTMNPH